MRALLPSRCGTSVVLMLRIVFVHPQSLRTAADYAFSLGYGYLGNYLSFGETSIDEAITAAQRRREEHFSVGGR